MVNERLAFKLSKKDGNRRTLEISPINVNSLSCRTTLGICSCGTKAPTYFSRVGKKESNSEEVYLCRYMVRSSWYFIYKVVVVVFKCTQYGSIVNCGGKTGYDCIEYSSGHRMWTKNIARILQDNCSEDVKIACFIVHLGKSGKQGGCKG